MILRLQKPQTKRWTREEYYVLAEQGHFQNQNVQLIRGEIIQMAPQGHSHAKVIIRLGELLRKHLPAGFHVREEKPLHTGVDSAPEPDLAVVSGSIDDYDDHPQTAVLVIEVSDSSVELDHAKTAIYAEAGVDEYWIVNIPEKQLEVHRRPIPSEGRFEEVSTFAGNQRISPASFTGISVLPAELFR
jgi:Uma2 family endonuclease